MSRPITRLQMPLFLVASIAVHAGLLAGVGQPWRISPTFALGETVLEVRFVNAKPVKPMIPATATASVLPAVERAAEDALPHEAADANRLRPPAFATAAVADTPAETAALDSRQSLHNQLLGLMKTRLSRYLTYPPQARRRGWEGTVLLGLRVEPDGHFNRIRVERSSGYAVLDDSALHSLKRLGYLVEARSWLDGNSLDIQIPVIFQLIEK